MHHCKLHQITLIQSFLIIQRFFHMTWPRMQAGRWFGQLLLVSMVVSFEKKYTHLITFKNRLLHQAPPL